MANTVNYAWPIVAATDMADTEFTPKVADFQVAVDAALYTLSTGKQPLAARLTEIVATGITTAMFAANVVDNDAALAANSSTRLATQAAVKAYMDGRIAAQDAMVFVGVMDCSANPNYPAADRGHTYKVSVAGKIGGASGPNVEVGDLLLCITDSTASGNHATVGANWNISQNNVDGAVTGPASSTAGNVPTFSGTSGKVLQDSGFTINQSLATTSSPTFAGVTLSGLTASRLVATNGSKAFVSTITSAALAASVSDETGSGALVFATSPVLVTPNLGTPSAGVLTSCTGLPVASGISGLGSGVATFLATPSATNLLAAVTGDVPMLRGAAETVTGAKRFSATVDAAANPASSFQIDFTNSTKVTVANASSATLGPAGVFSGIVVLHDDADGGAGMFLCAAGQVFKISGQTKYVANTATPGAGEVSVAYDASANYRIYNNQGSSRTFWVSMMRTRPAV